MTSAPSITVLDSGEKLIAVCVFCGAELGDDVPGFFDSVNLTPDTLLVDVADRGLPDVEGSIRKAMNSPGYQFGTDKYGHVRDWLLRDAERERRSHGTVGRNVRPTDPRNVIGVCRPCHSWITTHPKEATELGFLRHSWDWPLCAACEIPHDPEKGCLPGMSR